MAIVIRRLEEQDDVEEFDCGNGDLPLILLARLAVDRRFLGRGLARISHKPSLGISAETAATSRCATPALDALSQSKVAQTLSLQRPELACGSPMRSVAALQR